MSVITIFFSSESKTPTNANWVSRYCSREENRAYESDFLYIAGMMTKKKIETREMAMAQKYIIREISKSPFGLYYHHHHLT